MRINNDLTRATRRQAAAAAAAPEDWEATYRQMVIYDLAADIELGFFLAYYRNFAIPSIAASLLQNGEITERPMKRSYDTAIVIYELIASGMDSDRGRLMIRLLNHVHRHVPGENDDFLYVLLTLLVVPIRWARTHAWRPPTIAEEAAATRFYQQLGARMNITAIPATLTEAEQYFDSYERQNIAYSPAGAVLMASTVQVLKSRLTAPARAFTRLMLSTMFDDVQLTEALGLPRANNLTQTALAAVMHARNAIHRRRPMSTKPHFIPGDEGSSVYPKGYLLDEIGPENIMTHGRRANREPS